MRRLVMHGAAALAVWLGGCGGGVYVGIGLGDDDGTPPSVSLAASPSSAAPGGRVRLVAAAADANGIDSVAFYRLDGGVPVLLGSDSVSPFEWDAEVPADGRTQVSFFARAQDGSGERADSASVSVSISGTARP